MGTVQNGLLVYRVTQGSVLSPLLFPLYINNVGVNADEPILNVMLKNLKISPNLWFESQNDTFPS